MEAVFSAAEDVVARYFAEWVHRPERGTIEIAGERYVLVRAASLSVEFVSLVRSLFGEGREAEADEFARNILFDLAHAIGKSDARNFHIKMKLDDPVARLSAGPVHFAYSGWALVDISPESRAEPSEDYALVYDHPESFESSAWLAAGRSTAFPACVMSSGYSSGWCEESFGITLVASEILCRARGDDACRFVMAPPSRIEEVVERYKTSRPQIAARIQGHQIPDFFARKRAEDELRKSRDELDERVTARTADLERANARLVQAQKLEAVGRLAGGVAHDFNNILGVILGRSSMVQSRLSPGDPLWEDMEAIRSACVQGASLTRHMMAFSRSEAVHAEPLDLNDAVRSFGRGLLTLIGEEIEVALDLDPDGAVVLADPAQIDQVLVNLALNAAAAMGGGGKLTIRTFGEEVSGMPKTLTTGQLPPGPYSVLSVRDTGAGMDVPTQAKIFDPFFSTKPEGTGLGLSTVYGVVQQFRGGIDIASAPGAGTTFTLYFPRSELAAKAAADEPPRSDVVRGAARVLVVEDRDQLRDTIEEGLVAAGYQVMAVRDPMMALALVEKGDLELDVLVTDLVMPRLGGRELAARVRERRPAVRILYISGYDKQATEGRPDAVEAPSAPLLRKPFSIEELTNAIREVLANGVAPR
jgi:signal transduction histidine kinase/ActR/RegA family two-component response regulator